MAIVYRTPLRTGRISCLCSASLEKAGEDRGAARPPIAGVRRRFRRLRMPHSSNRSQTRHAEACDWRPNRHVRSADNYPHVDHDDPPYRSQSGSPSPDERLCKAQLTAYVAQAFFDETRNDFRGVSRIAKQRPIDDRMPCLISDLGQMNMSIVDRHEPTTILGTDRVGDLNYHF
jgi:hypothetical protein